MLNSKIVVLAFIMFLSGCSGFESRRAMQVASTPQSVPTEARNSAAFAPPAPRADQASQKVAMAVDRKVIRNAELTLEIDVPTEGKRKIEALAESFGGFVVTSEATDHGGEDADLRSMVKVVVRIPAARFAAALEEIRKVGRKVRYEKITGQDVTEEYFDLEARLKAKKALESQFLEIMKQAKGVSEALEVQKALADVRGEIEQMEGRRRFLENQVNLSTVTVTLETPAPLVSTSATGFWHGVKKAFGEGFDAALEIVLWLIRFVLALTPIVILVVLPLVYLWRRIRRRRAMHAVVPPAKA